MRYRVLKKCYVLDRIWNVGDVLVDFSGPGNPETMAPIDGAPMEARRLNIEGGAGLSLEKRSEIVSTRPVKN